MHAPCTQIQCSPQERATIYCRCAFGKTRVVADSIDLCLSFRSLCKEKGPLLHSMEPTCYSRTSVMSRLLLPLSPTLLLTHHVLSQTWTTVQSTPSPSTILTSGVINTIQILLFLQSTRVYMTVGSLNHKRAEPDSVRSNSRNTFGNIISHPPLGLWAEASEMTAGIVKRNWLRFVMRSKNSRTTLNYLLSRLSYRGNATVPPRWSKAEFVRGSRNRVQL